MAPLALTRHAPSLPPSLPHFFLSLPAAAVEGGREGGRAGASISSSFPSSPFREGKTPRAFLMTDARRGGREGGRVGRREGREAKLVLEREGGREGGREERKLSMCKAT